MRFWLSWYTRYAPTPYRRPVRTEWWHAGTRPAGRHVMYALVDAPTLQAAWRRVTDQWQDATERYDQQVPDGWRPPADRFPPQHGAASSGGAT